MYEGRESVELQLGLREMDVRTGGLMAQRGAGPEGRRALFFPASIVVNQ